MKIGIASDGLLLPAWQHLFLQQLLSAPDTEATFLLFSAASAVDGTQCRKPLLYRLFERYESARKQEISPDAGRMVDAQDLLADVKTVHLRLPEKQAKSETAPAPFDELKRERLDVILLLSRIPGAAALGSCATHGLWFFHHSLCPADHASCWCVGFREVIERQPVLYSDLRLRRPGLSDRILYSTTSAVDHLSHWKTRNQHLWKTGHLVPRAVQQLGQGGNNWPLQRREGACVDSVTASRATIAASLLQYSLWRLRQKVRRKLYVRRWILMTSRGANEHFSQFQKLIPPPGRFWADPHVIYRNDAWYIFFEDACLESWRGHISCMESRDGAQWSEPRTIITRPYHLSYPFLFEWQGSLYLVPESGENKTVELWRCQRFPFDWEFSHNLMHGVAAYDATLFEHEGLWWMFANVSSHEAASSWDELCIFYASSPLSDQWQPHPMNPVVSDVRSARPAGRIFRRDDRIYRPSQNSSHRYGYGLNINQVLELNKERYREQVVREVKPDWDARLSGLHSYSEAGGLTVIDAIYRSPRFGRRSEETAQGALAADFKPNL